MALTFQYLEDVADVSPQGAGFSYKDGRATSRYMVSYQTGVKNFAPNDLAIAVREILGDVRVSGLGLARTLPLAHPVYPWLYASDISEIRGSGPATRQNIANVAGANLLVPPITSTWMSYQVWYFTITFTPRPYAVLPDSSITQFSQANFTLGGGNGPQPAYDSWYPISTYNPVTAADPALQFDWVNEWTRYMDWEPSAQANSVTGNQGQMYFANKNIPNVPGKGQPPVFPGMPRMFLNEQGIAMTWFQVPMDPYITAPNSYIKMFRGRINQFDWLYWKAGELLYTNYTIHRYTPPVQKVVQVGDPFKEQGAKIQFSTQKYVDITFQFMECVRTTNDTYIPVAQNWRATAKNGWNLLPIAGDRNFFHWAYMPNQNAGVNAANKNGIDNENYWQPSWDSFPVQLLWTSPAGAQPAVQVL